MEVSVTSASHRHTVRGRGLTLPLSRVRAITLRPPGELRAGMVISPIGVSGPRARLTLDLSIANPFRFR